MEKERSFVLMNSWDGEAIPSWEQIEHKRLVHSMNDLQLASIILLKLLMTVL